MTTLLQCGAVCLLYICGSCLKKLERNLVNLTLSCEALLLLLKRMVYLECTLNQLEDLYEAFVETGGRDPGESQQDHVYKDTATL